MKENLDRVWLMWRELDPWSNPKEISRLAVDGMEERQVRGVEGRLGVEWGRMAAIFYDIFLLGCLSRYHSRQVCCKLFLINYLNGLTPHSFWPKMARRPSERNRGERKNETHWKERISMNYIFILFMYVFIYVHIYIRLYIYHVFDISFTKSTIQNQLYQTHHIISFLGFLV